MGKDSKIEWTHHTGNLWWGCTHVHRGCDNCYAETWANRWEKNVWGNDAPRQSVKSVWGNFLSWQSAAAEAGEIHRVFVGSMMDVFEKPFPVIDSKGVPMGQDTGDLRDRFFNEIVPACPNLMFLLLTKRPSNINRYAPTVWLDQQPDNVMYGASVVDQKSLIDVNRHLAKVNGKKFLSMEPLLDPVDLIEWNIDNLPDWIIVGGESGPRKRPFNANWARAIRDFCAMFEVPFFMKQMDKVQPIPEDLMIRETPKYFEYATNFL